MLVQQLRVSIIDALEQYFPDVPVHVEGILPTGPFFQPRMISVAYERYREGRNLAIYCFGISYKGGSPLEAEEIADQLQEALEYIEGAEGPYRSIRQTWESGEEGNDPLFTLEYRIHLQNERSEVVMMGHVTGGRGGLK